jgi:hypothetical protein
VCLLEEYKLGRQEKEEEKRRLRVLAPFLNSILTVPFGMFISSHSSH